MMKQNQYQTLRLILGDQLNLQHSWFQQPADNVLYLIAELKQETNYVNHHVQKVAAFFVAMGQFADSLTQLGFNVLHLDLDETKNQTLPELIKQLCQRFKIKCFEYQNPDEYRLHQQLLELDIQNDSNMQINCVESEHFYLSNAEVKQLFSANKHYRMESFYRKMRKDFSILMDNGKPLAGRWNYDAENRHKLKQKDILNIPSPLMFANDISETLTRIKRHQISTIGETEQKLIWPVNDAQARQLLAHFIQYCLPYFGQFQDAMTDQTKHKWSLYHSRLSFALNCKILSPKTVISAALQAYEQGVADIAQVEGFIRQILGWREYIRAIYWQNMPDYQNINHFNATNNLPEFFWHGKTQMQCMRQAISQSLTYAYAHHIQRLMITGNFCLLAEVQPDQVESWYLGIYIDAIEWVEMPNTRGMALYADGGIIASKPYCASGSYINRMSDYCQNCHYKVKEKVGNNACPFNSLYWRFMVKNRQQLGKNPRIAMLFKYWDKQTEQEQHAILQQAEDNLRNIENL